MFKRIVLSSVILSIFTFSLVRSEDMTGKYGLGYFNSQAPVGLRYWFNSQMGFDLGLGFESIDLGDESATNLYVEAGFPYVIFSKERANFMVRPGILYSSLDARPEGIASTKKWTKIGVSIMPVAEVFWGKHFSLSAGHGVEFETVSYPDEPEFGTLAGESRSNFKSIAASVTHLGFHFYFK